LDDIVETATRKAILRDRVAFNGRMNDELEYSFDYAKEAFVTLLKNILREPKNMPSEVFITSAKILDHGPFFSSGITPEQACNMLEEWLIEGGISKERISVGPLSNFIGTDRAKNNQAWLIYDRHNVPRDVQCKCLELPFPNFYSTAEEQGLLSADIEELSKNIRTTIEELEKADELETLY
jgi:hypothetical protein